MGLLAATENGWPQITRAQCDTLKVPGTNKVYLQQASGDASVVLTGWAAWIHRNVRSIEPPDGHRNWWCTDNPGENDVWNSNHYSGTAVDLCSDELPFKSYTMPQSQIDMMHRGEALFEGNIFWSGNWPAAYVDQMHSQCGYNTWDAGKGQPTAKFHEFAERLRNGYLNIFGPPDPLAFPLPPGYYYGPLDGPVESISGEWETDSQFAKDGLGRWQQALGLLVSKKWDDGLTPKAATTLQLQKGWQPNPLFGYGGVYEGEWNAVIRDGWRLPKDWDPNTVPDAEPPVVKWGDYSQYQSAIIDDTYPYPVVAFRASIANQVDTKFLQQMQVAREMVKAGKLKKIIAYHFWVPGFDNWGTFKSAIDQSGGIFPELCFMIDVEDGGSKWNISGDQSIGVNDFISKGMDYFQNKQAASGYLNFVANGSLWRSIPVGLKLIVPRYSGPDLEPVTPAGVRYFGHQYADNENTPPFGPSDINKSRMSLSMWLAAWGTPIVETPEVIDPTPPVVYTRREQLLAVVSQFTA